MTTRTVKLGGTAGSFKKGNTPWNKGLTKLTDERVMNQAKNKISKINLICHACNSKFQRNKSQLGRAKYCSIECRNIGHKGKHFSSITEIKKGDIRNRGINFYIDKSTGYLVKRINNKKICKHHQVWFEHNSFYPPKGFVIHHRNLDKTDNRIENLLMLDRASHTSAHQALQRGEII